MVKRKQRNIGGSATNKRGQRAGEVRIIGGDFRGRKLPVLQQQGLRPTADRVKETLFNWLQFEVPGSRCLDVYAGSGGLSFEALSRGAKQATLLELNPDNVMVLKNNLQTLKLDNASLIQTDSLHWLNNQAPHPYDIIFIDPPFHQEMMQSTIDLLFANDYVQSSSWLYIEQEVSLDWPTLPLGWEVYREKKTAQVKYGLFHAVD